jgi:hypothetical protein
MTAIFPIEVLRIQFLSILFIDWLIERIRSKKLFGGGVSAAAVRCGKTNILTEKKFFLRLKNFKLFKQTKGSSVYGCDFFKFIISCRGGHCDYSPRALKHSYATDGMSGLCMILVVLMDRKDVSRLKSRIFIQLKLCRIYLRIGRIQCVMWYV